MIESYKYIIALWYKHLSLELS